jgi:hypothetical protein
MLFSDASLASEPIRYDWENLTYTAELTEISSRAVLTVNLKNSKKKNGISLEDIQLSVNQKVLEIPEAVNAEFYSINPASFSISTEDISTKKNSNVFITIYFRYAGEKNLSGSVSFHNYKYYIRTVTEI